MSGQNWSITITPSDSGGPATFTPDLMGAKPGDPLQAGNADIISWNNRTADKHQPWPLDANGSPLSEAGAKAQGLYLSDVIPKWEPSTPGYVTAASTTAPNTTISYWCTFHHDERGSIVVWPT